MNITNKWKEIAALIEAGIADSPNGLFAISRHRFTRTHGLTDDQLHQLLMLNHNEERFAVEEYLGDFQFRLPPNH